MDFLSRWNASRHPITAMACGEKPIAKEIMPIAVVLSMQRLKVQTQSTGKGIDGNEAPHDVSWETWMQHPHSPAILFSRWNRRVRHPLQRF